MTGLRVARTQDLYGAELTAVRTLMDLAFDDFDDHDWAHALGGLHVIASDDDGSPLCHAALVPRALHAGGRVLRAGYVEAVATHPDHRGRDLGTSAMDLVDALIARDYEMGALGTGSFHFYERLGWRRWAGKLFVRSPDGDSRTPSEEGFVMVLTTATTADLDLTGPLTCEHRSGDVW